MPQIVPCPSCTKKVNIPDEMFGKAVECPYCDKPFKAPEKVRTEQRNEFIPTEDMGVYASAGNRFLAALIDGLILFVPLYLLRLLLRTDESLAPTNLLLAAINIIVPWIYFASFESSASMATPAKQMLGMCVTSVDKKPISFAQATGRYFGKSLSGLLCGAGYLPILFTPTRQGLHDNLASTVVLQADKLPKRRLKRQ